MKYIKPNKEFYDQFDDYEANKHYEKGDVFKYSNTLWEVQSSHTSSESAPVTRSAGLYRPLVQRDDVVLDYKMMAYKKGELVRYKERIYESRIDNNTYMPTNGDYWIEVT